MTQEPALTRRGLLGVAAGGVALAAFGRGRLWPARRRPRVIVVGAGLAGLSAADLLRRGDCDVVVLEARPRVGGRVLTLRSFDASQVAEAGGEFIDVSHTQMRRAAHHFGIPLDDLRKAGSDLPGAAYRRSRRSREDSLYTDSVNRSLERYNARMAQISRGLDGSDPVARGARLDRLSVADLLDELRLDPLARELIEHAYIRDDYTVEASELSLLFHAGQEALGREAAESGAEAFRMRGGNDRLPRALARELGDRVSLSAAVTAVATTSEGVKVTAGGERLSGDWCVLAAPLPALRAIAFSPALPATLSAAAAELAYGTGSKVLLQYGSRVWRGAGFNGDTFTDLGVSSTWEATDAQKGRAGILVGYAVGAPGRAYAALSDADRAAAASADIETIYRGSRAKLGRTRTVSWEGEPYTGGTYTAYAPGQVTKFWRALRRPHGRIHLAGEHTSAYTGYMEGALRSGRRAATAILRAEGV